MKFLIICFLSFLSFASFAQNQALLNFNEEKSQISKRSMYALGGWAAGNFIISGIATGSATGSDLYFHQMNIYWNTVNLGLAVVGLVGANKDNFDKSAFLTLKGQNSTENIYLLNAGLDVAYITGGLYMAEIGKSGDSNKDMFQGFGYSIAFQGGFLLILDTVMYIVHKNHRAKKLDPLFENLDISMNRVRLSF